MSKIESILEKASQMREGKAHQPSRQVTERRELTMPFIEPEIYQADTRLTVTNPYLVAINDSRSPITEEYRKLKSILLKMTNSGQLQNTIMVTSAVSGEGKTITSINLAVAMAQEYDHTVLLVDADLRRPGMSKYLGIKSEVGLSDYLYGKVALKDVLVKTGIGRLVVLPAGSRVENPVELLSSSRMQNFITEIKNRYLDRYIIIDTPPLLSFAETYSLANMVDGVVFVVKECGATMNNIKDALGHLKQEKVFGVIYNNVGISRFDDNYRYRNYHSYYKDTGAQ